jgi:hypothetical protein
MSSTVDIGYTSQRAPQAEVARCVIVTVADHNRLIDGDSVTALVANSGLHRLYQMRAR